MSPSPRLEPNQVHAPNQSANDNHNNNLLASIPFCLPTLTLVVKFKKISQPLDVSRPTNLVELSIR